jgi:tRNA 2-thiouridine synthesizing protein A
MFFAQVGFFVFKKHYSETECKMALHLLDASGLRCPQPILKIAVKSPGMQPGDILEVTGDCPTFENDVRVWCARLKKTLIMVRAEEGYRKTVQILF